MDYLIKAVDQSKNFRLLLLNGKEMVEDAVKYRKVQPGSYRLLGEALMATSLLSSAELTDEEELTVRLQTNSEFGNLVITGQANGDVKGYVDNLDVPTFLKLDSGVMNVTKDLGMREPFNGQIPILPLSVAENFVAYLSESEQIRSAMGLSMTLKVNQQIESAGGFLIQALPGATEEQIQDLETRLSEINFDQMMQDAGNDEKIVEQLLGSGYKILEKTTSRFHCDSSKEKFGKIIATLDKSEIQAMIDEDHGAVANCKFCGQSYEFSEEDLRQMLQNR